MRRTRSARARGPGAAPPPARLPCGGLHLHLRRRQQRHRAGHRRDRPRPAAAGHDLRQLHHGATQRLRLRASTPRNVVTCTDGTIPPESTESVSRSSSSPRGDRRPDHQHGDRRPEQRHLRGRRDEQHRQPTTQVATGIDLSSSRATPATVATHPARAPDLADRDGPGSTRSPPAARRPTRSTSTTSARRT